jgi:hypothetical protein
MSNLSGRPSPADEQNFIQPQLKGDQMTSADMDKPRGWRVLGFGKHPENAAAIQAHLRSEGLRARNFALTDDRDGDEQLIRELTGDTWDAVAIGGFINGQDPEIPPTEQTTQWFNRILNLIKTHAPTAKIILVRTPPDALPAVERVLGTVSAPSTADQHQRS